MPAVSVVLPVYNALGYLAEAVESVLRQTAGDLELIIVDDGSTDRSGAVADDFAARDSRVKVIHSENRGLSAARNTGTDAATARWITFVDADDVLAPQALEWLLSAVAENPEADMIMGHATRRLPFEAPESKPRFHTREPEALLEDTLYQRGPLHSAWGKLYRRQMLAQTRFTPGILYEDLDFFYRYCLQCRTAAVSDVPLYYYRPTPGSITNCWNPRRLDVLRVMERMEQTLSATHPHLLPAVRERRLSASFDMFVRTTRAGLTDEAANIWHEIRRLRRGSLLNPNVRLKNRAAALVSYLGRHIFTLIAKTTR